MDRGERAKKSADASLKRKAVRDIKKKKLNTAMLYLLYK